MPANRGVRSCPLLVRPGEVLLANDLVGFQLGYFVLGQAKQVPEDVLVVLAQAVCGDADAQGRLGELPHYAGVQVRPGLRVGDLLEEAPFLYVRIGLHLAVVKDRPDGDPNRLQQVHDLVVVVLDGPLPH